MANKLDTYLRAAVEAGASDLHLLAGRPPYLRIDGALGLLPDAPTLSADDTESLVFAMLTEPQRESFRRTRDLDFSYALPNAARFRVNCHYEKDAVGLVARVVSMAIPSVEEVMLPDHIVGLLELRQGLILVTGPTGCGKSTTLAAMIDHINLTRACHIVTLEDPIEFVYEPKRSIIKQRQLGTDMVSFGQGLKHVVRQDPNVILVGEMRDLETIGTTITLAETGHLVLATLHTFNAAQTIDRIIDVFPSHQQDQVRLQLSLFLKAIISQQLLPRKGKKGDRPTGKAQAISSGRVAAREILINTPAVANLIRENKVAQIKTTIQTSSEEGMLTMDQHLRELYQEGYITEDTVVSYVAEPGILK